VPSKRVVNASPLILLGKLGRLDLLFLGVEDVIVPEIVLQEVGDPRQGELPGWDPSLPALSVETAVSIPPDVYRYALDPGESMVLAIALAEAATAVDVEVVLDEKKGRRSAKALNLAVIGTAGLLVVGKREGRLPLVAPLLDELERHGMYLGKELKRIICEKSGEAQSYEV
jgi:predicted nucleic acid-binding protein